MINKITPSFGSTYLSETYMQNTKGKSFNTVINDLGLNPYFNVKFINTSKSAEAIRRQFTLGEAVFVANKDAFIMGADREADEFIARKIKEVDPEAVYVQDTPETDFGNGPIFDLEI